MPEEKTKINAAPEVKKAAKIDNNTSTKKDALKQDSLRQDLGQDFLKKDSPKPQVLSSTIEKSDAKSDLKSDIPIIYIDTKNINDDLFGELRRYAETKGIILEKKTGSSQYDALDNTYDRRNSLDKSPEKNITNASNDSSDLKKIYGSAIVHHSMQMVQRMITIN